MCLMANQNDATAEINEQHRQEDCLWKQKQQHEYFWPLKLGRLSLLLLLLLLLSLIIIIVVVIKREKIQHKQQHI